MKDKLEKQAWRAAVEEMRNKYADQIEHTIQALMDLRDTAEKDADKVKASDTLLKWLSGRMSETAKTSKASPEKLAETPEPTLPPELELLLANILHKPAA